jgi:hypothetical protein
LITKAHAAHQPADAFAPDGVAVVPEIRAEISLPVERTFHGKFGHDHDRAVTSGGFCRASGEAVSVNLETAASLFAESDSRKRRFPLADARH